MRYSDQQIKRANEVDLVSFLSARGEAFKKSGRELKWLRHDSMTINGNRWYRFSEDKGGHPIDFMMTFYDLSFPEAVRELIGEEPEGERWEEDKDYHGGIPPGPAEEEGRSRSCRPIPSAPEEETELKKEDKKTFILPERSKTGDQVMEYLTEKRKLDKDLVKEMMEQGLIYEEKDHHNAVFVGKDREGNPRYACLRGTGEERFRMDARGSDKRYGFSIRQRSNVLFVFEAPIDLLSFKTLFPDYGRENMLALGGIGAAALEQFLSDSPDIDLVFLCLDDDRAGMKACDELAMRIPPGISVARFIPGKKDWNEVLVNKDEIPKDLWMKGPVVIMDQMKKKATVDVTKMSEVETQDIHWLWYPFIPFGKVTLMQGDPCQGKTWLAMLIAAFCSSGKALPGEKEMEAFTVVYQTAEDGIADTIKPRLTLCGADMEKVIFINEDEKQLSLTDERIEAAILENGAKLLILDPIQAYLGADVDMNRANEIRPIFRSLAGVAERTGCAIVLIGHLNKNAGQQSNYRGLGSIDIAAAVRSILYVAKVENEKDEDVRVVIQTKDSLAPAMTPVAFSLDEEGPRFLGRYEITMEELLSGKKGVKTESKIEQAMMLIRNKLADGRQMFLKELEAEAGRLGISSRTMRDARSRMAGELEYGSINRNKIIKLKEKTAEKTS